MKTIRLAFAVLLMAAAIPADSGEVPLDGTPLWQMGMFIGNWEIDTQWSDGTPLWTRNEFTVGIGGQFVEIRTFTRDEKGEVYERYYTIFSADAETGKVTSYGFTYDGTVTVVDDVGITGSVTDAALTSRWGTGDSQIRQTVQIVSRDAYSWKVWAGSDENWTLIMDGVYDRVD
jgi:hypothetical protein